MQMVVVYMTKKIKVGPHTQARGKARVDKLLVPEQYCS